MANRIGAASNDHARDHKGLIYAIAGGILAVGILMMTFYDRVADPVAPTARSSIVTAQR